MSNSNIPRGTPGLLLLVFAIAMILIALWGWLRLAPRAAPGSQGSRVAAAAML